MQRVSSNWTLFYRLFLPSFWLVFFGALTIALFNINAGYFQAGGGRYIRLGLLLLVILSFVVFYFTVFRLKRVELNAESIYVTNYFRHYRYPINNVAKITEKNYGFIKIGVVHLKEKGSFGKTLAFMISKTEYQHFWDHHPKLRERLLR